MPSRRKVAATPSQHLGGPAKLLPPAPPPDAIPASCARRSARKGGFMTDVTVVTAVGAERLARVRSGAALVRRGRVRKGTDCQGEAGSGLARSGKVGLGEVRYAGVRCGLVGPG